MAHRRGLRRRGGGGQGSLTPPTGAAGLPEDAGSCRTPPGRGWPRRRSARRARPAILQAAAEAGPVDRPHPARARAATATGGVLAGGLVEAGPAPRPLLPLVPLSRWTSTIRCPARLPTAPAPGAGPRRPDPKSGPEGRGGDPGHAGWRCSGWRTKAWLGVARDSTDPQYPEGAGCRSKVLRGVPQNRIDKEPGGRLLDSWLKRFQLATLPARRPWRRGRG